MPSKDAQVRNIVSEKRKDKGVTQQEFADAVGVSRQTVISIEKGNYVPSVLLALRIAEYFNSSVEDIFTIE